LSEFAVGTKRRLVFLGTGTSTGVPTIGCECSVCTSTDPRNQRTRPSVLMELPGGNLLIDTTPEMRLQLLRERIRRVHAIAFTHHHADHLFGLDDARLFPRWLGGPVPIYCEATTEECIRRVFPYAFQEGSERIGSGFVPKMRFIRVEPGVPFEVVGERVLPIRLEHGRSPVLGFRVGSLAYCTDVSRIPEASMAMLQGLDVLVLDALRFEPHSTHFSLGEALEVVATLRPRRTFLTHLSHSFDHGATQARLPEDVWLSYDGLSVEF
jgi:phosphoribosyl 1,2-cyclic phosphate phosphodiesterase